MWTNDGLGVRCDRCRAPVELGRELRVMVGQAVIAELCRHCAEITIRDVTANLETKPGPVAGGRPA